MYCKLAVRKRQKEEQAKTITPDQSEEESENELDKLDFMVELEKLRPYLGSICVNKLGDIIDISK